ncbi:uncharacterized protein TrAFT101_010244 [Trichoderma asperellum]|uniref:uncharacterized protein n=1 Tax=Trichoderma asperellum TaxID=101201 RepID=UPI00331808D3|nr:hypothetical protein TrAFT101_010244 [Trichoderma asperellum]
MADCSARGREFPIFSLRLKAGRDIELQLEGSRLSLTAQFGEIPRCWSSCHCIAAS